MGLVSVRSLVFSAAATCNLCFSSPSGAADVSLRDGRIEGDYFVSISGEIKKGDLNKVNAASKKAIQRGSELEFVLDSPGGDVDEAIAIGRFAREMLGHVFS